MADPSSSQKKSQTKKRHRSYSASHTPSSSSKTQGAYRWGHKSPSSTSEGASSELQDTNDGRKRSKSFLDYFKSKTHRHKSTETSESSVEKEGKSSPSTDAVLAKQGECIRVVITALDPQMNYKTIPISSTTTAHEVIATLTNKFAITSKNQNTDAFYLNEVRESDQGSYSRLLQDDEKVHEIQKKWLNGKLCYLELCRKQPTHKLLVPQDDFIDHGPIRAIVLSPSQDSSFFPDCKLQDNSESQPSDSTSMSAIHHIRDVKPPPTPSDNSDANSVDLFTSSLVAATLEQTMSDENNKVRHSNVLSTGIQPDAEREMIVASPTSIPTGSHSSEHMLEQSVVPVKDSPQSTEQPQSSHDPLDSPKREDFWFLKSLVCSPVDSQKRNALPNFRFDSSTELGEKSETVKHKTVALKHGSLQQSKTSTKASFETCLTVYPKFQTIAKTECSEVVQHKTLVLKHGFLHRESKTSKMLTEVAFETCLTIYPKFQTTASLFPSCPQNKDYNTEMNIFDSLATLLDSKIPQGTKMSKKVQNVRSGYPIQRITEENHTRSGLKSDTFWSPSSLSYTSSLGQLPTLSASTCTRRITTSRTLMRAYSKSTTCISSEVQSDLDAVIYEKQLQNQSIEEGSTPVHIRGQSTPVLLSLQPSQMQPSGSKTVASIRPRVYSNPISLKHQSQASHTFRSLEKQHRHERSSSEILLTFKNNQRPITVLLHSKSSTTLHSYSPTSNSQSQSTADLSHSSSEILSRARKRQDRPTSAPQQRQHGNLEGLMDSIHQKAEKKWWTQM